MQNRRIYERSTPRGSQYAPRQSNIPRNLASVKVAVRVVATTDW
jgi:hypothetical protein